MVDPIKKWKDVKIRRIHFTEAIKLTKKHKGPFYKSLKLGYKYVAKRSSESISRFIGAYYSLLNAAYENQRIVFSISQQSLNKIISSDQNLQQKQAFSKEDYRTFIYFLTSNKLMSVHNPNRSGKEALIVELQDPDFIDFFIKSGVMNRDEQLAEVLGFNQNKKVEERKEPSIKKTDISNKKTDEKKTASLELRTKNIELRTKNLEPTTTTVDKTAVEADVNKTKEEDREMAIKRFLLDSVINAQEMIRNGQLIDVDKDLREYGIYSHNFENDTLEDITRLFTEDKEAEKEEAIKNDQADWEQSVKKLQNFLGPAFNDLKNVDFVVKMMPIMKLETIKNPTDRAMLASRIDRLGGYIYEPSKGEKGLRIRDKVAPLLDFVTHFGELFPLDMFLKIIDKAFEDRPSNVHKTVKDLYKQEFERQYRQNLLQFQQKSSRR